MEDYTALVSLIVLLLLWLDARKFVRKMESTRTQPAFEDRQDRKNCLNEIVYLIPIDQEHLLSVFFRRYRVTKEELVEILLRVHCEALNQDCRRMIFDYLEFVEQISPEDNQKILSKYSQLLSEEDLNHLFDYLGKNKENIGI